MVNMHLMKMRAISFSLIFLLGGGSIYARKVCMVIVWSFVGIICSIG